MSGTCKLTMQPQDGYVRELEVKVNGVNEVLTDETYYSPEELPMSWTFTGVEEVWWAKGGDEYADHYVVKDCQIYDAETGLPGYHGETPYWRASIKLEKVTTTTTAPSPTTSTTLPSSTTTSTIVEESTTTSQPEMITTSASTPTTEPPSTTTIIEVPTTSTSLPTILPVTGPAQWAGMFTIALAFFGAGLIINSYVTDHKQKRERRLARERRLQEVRSEETL